MSVMVCSLFSVLLFISTISTSTPENTSTILSTWNEFYQFVVTTQNTTCHSDRLCSYNRTRIKPICRLCPPCQCDSLCEHYSDCCPDKALTKVTTGESTRQKYRCQTDTFKLSQNHMTKKHIFVYDLCLDNTNRTLVNLCKKPNTTNIWMNIPVTSLSGEVYRNQYCAICNGNYDFRFWNIRSECSAIISIPRELSTEAMIDLFLMHDKCSIFYSPVNGTRVRECFAPSNDLVQSCNVTGFWNVYDEKMAMACQLVLNPIKQGTLIFRNIFCMYCNNVLPFLPGLMCMFDTPFPFSVIIDPTTSQKIQEKANPKNPCSYNEIFDKFQDKCRHIYCSVKRLLDTINRKCDVLFQSAKGIAYELKVSLNTSQQYDIGPNAYQWFSTVSLQFKDVFEDKLQTSDIYYDMFRLQMFMKLNDTFLHRLIFHTKFIVMSEVTLELLEMRLIRMLNSNWIIRIGQIQINMTSSPIVITSDEDANVNDIVKKEINLLIQPKMTLPYVVPKPYSYSVVSETLQCPFLYYKQSEYYIRGSKLILSASNTSVDAGLFVLQDNNTVIICLEVITKISTNIKYVSPYDIFSTQLIIISLVCQSVSLLCLLMTLLTFCLLPPLRTLPGKNTMGLILTLICALMLQTFGIARVELFIVCRIIGICFHFFLLSSFSWMLICTVHMFRVFRNMLSSRIIESDERKQFNYYVIISLLIPAAVIIATVIVNITVKDGKDFGYGNGICYISNFYSIIGSLIVPVLIIVLVNIVLFISTIITLRRFSSDSDLIGKRNYLSVYVKMSTLTGVNWMTGFVAAATHSQVLWYIFTVLCGLQGVYIFIAFVCNRRVFTLVRTQCWTRKAKNKGTSNKTLSSPTSTGNRSPIRVSAIPLSTVTCPTDTMYSNAADSTSL